MNCLFEINSERIVVRKGLQVRVGDSVHDDEWCDA